MVVIKLQQLYFTILFQDTVQVPHLPVHLGHHCIICQSLTDTLSNLIRGCLPREPINLFPVGKSDCYGCLLLGFKFSIVFSLQLIKHLYALVYVSWWRVQFTFTTSTVTTFFLPCISFLFLLFILAGLLLLLLLFIRFLFLFCWLLFLFIFSWFCNLCFCDFQLIHISIYFGHI